MKIATQGTDCFRKEMLSLTQLFAVHAICVWQDRLKATSKEVSRDQKIGILERSQLTEKSTGLRHRRCYSTFRSYGLCACNFHADLCHRTCRTRYRALAMKDTPPLLVTPRLRLQQSSLTRFAVTPCSRC